MPGPKTFMMQRGEDLRRNARSDEELAAQIEGMSTFEINKFAMGRTNKLADDTELQIDNSETEEDK